MLLERTQSDKAKADEVLQRAMAAIKDDAAPIVAEKEKRENELIPLRQRVNKAKYEDIDFLMGRSCHGSCKMTMLSLMN